ncbi:hypothetical protein AGABI1DRAFT_131058 [Agaricus bisporus var. burnettii JB137-S8]|uniref:Cytochrome P450 n=1 Tax=Agaricus bisporus var. burnettii (strain JB137-S8 / ATCC MYA-4627 / FGSC 10392) TaxID=597362 RepID=K5X1I3_AGABU|nr:uncharacterized protein AGABI1DRAFT_131058 [Agaricus bisporus var. burnettii JB137-S8]EKM76767.1 hypothetical protein AGABI1DRAFT_131058 [Agaricus bisporus var. burnettii JB137-S8]
MFSQVKISLSEIVTAATVAWVAQVLLGKWIKAKHVARELSSCPPTSALTLFNPFRPISLAIGSFYPFKNQLGNMFARFSLYKKYGSTCLVSATFWDAIPTYWFADADALKTITSDRFTFMKDVEAYETLNVYGHSIVGQEGTEWKRHRAVAMNAFNEANNALVWRESTRTVNKWFTQIDAVPLDESIDLLRDLTRATLLIIGSAGFGRHAPWVEDSSSLSHKVNLSSAVEEATAQLLPRILIPKFIWNAITQNNVYIPFFKPVVDKAQDALEVLRGHMAEIISEARSRLINDEKDNEDGAALLKNLVEANMMTFEQGNEGGYKSLTDEELYSNMFMYYLAGHETTAHTLCFVFVYLALYPECQQKVFEEILKIYPNGVPTEAPPSSYKKILPQLEYTSAVLHESLRLCPPVIRLVKLAQRDTILKSKRFVMSSKGNIGSTEVVDVPIEKGAMCVLDILGLHMNLIHWGNDVEKFKPERFIDTPHYTWPRDAFLAFSGGPRSCIGQRFAITESVCIIASVVRRYEVLLPQDVLAMKLEEQERRLLDWKPGMTIIPANARVRFKKREI